MTADQKGCEGAGIGRTRGQLAQREQGRARNPQQLTDLAGAVDGPWRDALGVQEVGKLVREDPGGAFRLVSKDSGFDSLIAHLRCAALMWSDGMNCPEVLRSLLALLLR